jgi:hypothetical protein
MGMNRLMVGLAACALLGAAAADVAAQPFGYVVNAADPTDDGSHDNLWRINLADGSTERIGPLNVPGAVNSDVEALALESARYLLGVDDATDSLLVIDINTGAGRAIDRDRDNLRLGLNGSPLDAGLGFGCSGDLLMTSASRRQLYRLNELTGQASAIGSGFGVHIGDIAARGEAIFGIGIAGDEGLYRIDPQAGTATRIGGFGIDIRLAAAGLDTDRSGNLWAIGHVVDGTGQPQPSRILRIDHATGAATAGPTTLTGVKSLAIAPPGDCDDFSSPPPGPGPGPGEGPRGDAPAGVPVNSPLALLLLGAAFLAAAWRGRRSMRQPR